MQRQKVLYFDIEGISCSGCTSQIENKLQVDSNIKEIKINVVTKRARVVVKEFVHPNEIITSIKEIDNKFVAHWLLPKEVKHFYFSITGMKSVQDKVRIEKVLNDHPEDIINSKVNYSTGVVTITSFFSNDQDKNSQHINYLSKIIENSISGDRIHAKPFESPIKETYIKAQPALLFYRRALINALVFVPLFLISGIIPLPITLTGQMVGLFIGGITLGVMWTTGKEFYVGAFKKLIEDHSSDMNTLIALGTGSAWVYSIIIALVPTLFPIAALQYHFLAINMILGIVNFGKGMRTNAEEKTKNEVLELGQVYVELQPQHALKLTKEYHPDYDVKNNSIDIHYLDIKENDILFVPKGKHFPVEGVIISDEETMVDEKLRTGENAPNNKKKGDSVLSGSLNKKHPVFIRAMADGPNGQLEQTIRFMDSASESKLPVSGKIDKLAAVFVPTIILISFITGLGWLIFGPAPVLPWIIKSVMAVYLCACPCALWLTFPIAVEIGIRKHYNQKIMVRKAAALETAAQIDTVIFDKTGVLTTLAVSLEDCIFKEGSNGNKIMQLAASLESHYKHPIAKAITSVHSIKELLSCEKWSQGEQGGVSGLVDNCEVLIGNDSHLVANNIEIPKHFIEQEELNANRGMSSVYVAISGQCVGVIALNQEIRHDAEKTIKDLKERDIDVIMLTGDKKAAAKAVAEKIGISKYFAGCTEQKKEEVILSLKERKAVVAMIGDEINDVYALNAAHLSISFGSWTNIASKAQVIVSQLTNIMHLMIISKETMRIIDQNLYWTGFYNLLSLIAATGLLYSVYGFVLNPIVASMGMTLSSTFVVLNSLRLTYRIDYLIDVYENKITPPKTFFEWVKSFFAVNGLYQLLKAVYKPKTKPQPQQPPKKSTPVPIIIPNCEFNSSFNINTPNNSPVKNKLPSKNRSSYNPIVVVDDDTTPNQKLNF